MLFVPPEKIAFSVSRKVTDRAGFFSQCDVTFKLEMSPDNSDNTCYGQVCPGETERGYI